MCRMQARTHVDANSEAVWHELLGRLDVNVTRGSRGSRVEVRVVRSKLATEGYKNELSSQDEMFDDGIC
jgi:hypothetical protein